MDPRLFISAVMGGGVITPLNAAKAFFKEWIDPTQASLITAPSNIVSKITSPLADGFANPRNFQRSTNAGTANRPAITANRLVFDGVNDCLDGSAGYTLLSTITAPDNRYCPAGKGPTNCGIVRLSNGSFWTGNFGKLNQSTSGTETFDGSLIHYSDDTFQTVLQEIYFQDLGLSGVGIQDVAYDPSDGQIFCSDPGNSKIYKINPVGPAITLNLTVGVAANGMTLNTLTNELLVGIPASANITRINKTTGATIGTLAGFLRDITDSASDLLDFDASYGSAGALIQTTRDNGSAGRVIKYDIASGGTPLKAWSIPDVPSIEGFCQGPNGTAYLCTDNAYHSQGDLTNHIVKISLDTSSPDIGTRLIIAFVGKVAATPAGTVAFLWGGDSINRKGAGVFFTTTANQLRFIFRGSSTQATLDWLLTSTTTEFLGYLDCNTATGDVSLYVNTVFVSTQNSAQIVGVIPSLLWTDAASYETAAVAARFCAETNGGFVISTDPLHRAEVEGLLNWGGGTPVNKGLLPVGHTYELAAPV